MSKDDSRSTALLPTIGWSVYLAVSWTWCIGMFFPVLVMRDFGVPGYLAFALPNVIGAAAMGWILRSPEASRRFVERHRGACAAFSVVTVIFHLAFVLHVIYPLDALRVGALGVVGVLLGSLVLTAIDRPRSVALVVYLVSVAVIAALATRVGLPLESVDPVATEAAGALRLRAHEVVYLLPVCIFGFLLCPYLDLTFHRARQHLSGGSSKLGFGLGFGLFFFAMILFTPLYAGLFVPEYRPAGARPSTFVLNAIVLHLAAQVAATIAFHLRGLRDLRSFGPARPLMVGLVAIALLTLAFIAMPRAGAPLPPALADAEDKLVWYRVLLSNYGLVFPAYMWLLAIPTADGHAGPGGLEGRRKLRVLVIAIALAAPCFWVGFIERETWWLALGMMVLIVARLFVRPRERRYLADAS